MAEDNPGLRRSLNILSVISEHPEGINFTNLRIICGDLPSATLSRLLRVITEEGWCHKREDGLYYPGRELVRAANRLSIPENIEELINARIEQLARETGESASYVLWNLRKGITFTHKCEMPDSYHYLDIGKSNTIYHLHGFSRLAMAYHSKEEIEKLFIRIKATDADVQSFFTQQESLQKSGCIIHADRGIRIGATVFNHAGKAVAIAGISLLPRELGGNEQSELLSSVISAARDITAYHQRCTENTGIKA